MLINQLEKLIFVKARSNLLCLSSITLLAIVVLPSVSTHAQQAPVYTTNVGNAAQTEIRIQEMENQIRQLTGKVEEQLYQINSLKQKVNRLEKFDQQQGAVAPRQPSSQSGRIDTSQKQRIMDDRLNMNPLANAIADQQPKAMQTKTVIGSSNDATAQYEKAYAALKTKNYEEAQKGFDSFLSVHSDHVLAANAKYWLGETHYVRGDYKTAARAFAEGFQKYPDSAKSPDILLKLGMSLKGLGNSKDACVALGQVAVKFPTGYDQVVKRAVQERDNLSCDT